MPTRRRVALMLLSLLLIIGAAPALAHDDDDHDDQASAATIAARQKFFGAENVRGRDGDVSHDRVIFSWVTNTTLAVSIKGRIVLLDSYVNRLEVPPAAGQIDLRRTPINVQDLVDLHPEAIFLGHGHGDHADNAAYVAKWLDIPIYASPETCDVMQADVIRMFNDPNTVNGGTRLIPNGLPVKCIGVVTRGSVPGSEVLTIRQLEPLACIIVFKHIHSGTAPRDASIPLIPVSNVSDSREAQLYPPGTCVTPTNANGLQGCLGVGTFNPPVAGQMNLTTTGFGSIPGSAGGAISLFYQFVLRNDDNDFSFVWHNTTGPLKEGIGSDPGLPSPSVGARLFAIMDQLPPTDLELGSVVSLGFSTNGVRDPVMYQQHLKPQVYIPLHMTDVAAVSSSLEWKKSYLQLAAAMGLDPKPEIRWLVDPDDYLRPMVYDPDDPRWFSPAKRQRVRQFCH